MSVLRPSGGDAVVGLIGVFIAMLSIGLAIVALDDDKEITVLAKIPFGVGVIFLLWFILASLYLAIRAATIAKRITGVIGYIRSGIMLRGAVRGGVMTDEQIQHWIDAWYEVTKTWIESEEPDYLPDFELGGKETTPSFTGGGMSNFAHGAVQLIDGKLGALQGLLSHLRASR